MPHDADASPRPRSPARRSALVFFALLAAYHVNGDFLVGHDATPNVYLPVVILDEGRFTFAPGDPLLSWALPAGDATRPLPYYLVETRRPDAFVGAYGPGPGLVALPVFAVLSRASGGLAERPAWIWYGGKLVASLLTAASAVFVLLAARRWLPLEAASGLALFYGLGTSAFATASQALTQHAPVLFFLAAALWLLDGAGRRRDLAAGLALGAAVVCRPHCAVLVAPVALALAWRRRGVPWTFVCGALPMIAFLLAFDQHYLGHPFRTGQSLLGERFALRTTGSADLWQTPLLEGLAGLLISPSRGLLVYTPAFALAFAGIGVAWRDARWRALRPWSLGCGLLLLLSAKYFNWWGGWSFGYRYLLDAAPVLTLLMVPALVRFAGRRWLRPALVVGTTASIGVQLVGAFLYDVSGWNAGVTERARPERGPRLEMRDVDDPAHRARLWSIADSQLVHALRLAPELRRSKRAGMARWLDDSASRVGPNTPLDAPAQE